ncbi:hypothetical protein HIP83_11460 [Staphylococcus coagulans]|uniref:hypothetical protein n=1 Tax=Staphylococcus TaxID=1279 RepID=UPI00069E9F3E|nr:MULTISPECIES: hypothetical protein [Staphylococcus]MBS3379490.1 hypothetical protein [Staphylococcus aureus]MBS3384739.1 hypothetical protein [Staphylococcus aureus]MBT2833691.1 hypothetical protein [Staphylococcus coagulans]
MRKKVYIENRYLNYLIFSDIEESKSAKQLFDSIGNWIFSNSNQQEAKFLITEMVCEIFELQFKVDFKYRSEIIEAIKSKSEYIHVKEKMKKDIIRAYTETQQFLKDNRNNNDFIILYRSLNRNELELFKSGNQKVTSNILNSFSTDPNYHRRELQVSVKVPIKNVLFYDNLCPMSRSTNLGLFVEREAIVICEDSEFLIDEVISEDINIRKCRDIEENYN